MSKRNINPYYIGFYLFKKIEERHAVMGEREREREKKRRKKREIERDI